jgi:hypothetical protein
MAKPHLTGPKPYEKQEGKGTMTTVYTSESYRKLQKNIYRRDYLGDRGVDGR